MECNRDEATRAKEIAEKKFAARDVAGAKKFALKAQSLYPGLEGLPQMLATLDVHLSAETKVGGEADWYGILSVNPMADDESIKKQYRKLALMLHPDKNKSVGADGAFKLISEAWSFLSDKTKKIYYDQRRFPKASQLKVPPTNRSSSVPPTANGFHNVSNSNTNSRAHKTSGKVGTATSGKVGTAASGKVGTAASGKVSTAASGKVSATPSGKVSGTPSGKVSGTPSGKVSTAPSGKVSTAPSGKVSTAPSGKVGTSPSGKVSTAPSGKVGTSTSGKVGTAPSGKVGTSTPSHPFKTTFWTVCTRCKMQYEYLRVYLNHNLLCPHCHEPFLAVETAAPLSKGSKSSTPFTPSQQSQNSSHHSASNSAHASAANTGPASNLGSSAFAGVKLPNQSNFKCGAFSQTAGVGCTTSSTSAAAQAASGVQPTYDKVGREHEAIRRKHPVSKVPNGSSTGFKSDPKGERLTKKRKMTDDFGGNAPKQMAPGIGGMGMDASGIKQSGFEKDRPNFVPVPNKPNSTRDLSPLELRNMLMEKARKEILKKLNEWKSATAGTGAEKGKPAEEVKREKLKLKKTSAVNGDTSDQNKEVESADAKKKFQDKASLETTGVDSDTEAPMSIIVPDSDFHDFDKDRCERSFIENEVWAAYDDDDGMPRYYAMIHHVMSLKPFKMKISWLNSKTNNELGPLNWIGSGFYKTCGDFRIGKYEVNKSLNSFSHRVCGWTKGTRGAIRIFPRKGDVWALYRNWSPDWNEHTPDEVIHKYDMVEVLEDYIEEQGVSFTPLVKVTGFKAVFHRHLDPKEIRTISRGEMFRFSHQVPSYLLTGSEAQNVPDGSRELDPAATPLELLQVITEAKENKVENRDEQVMTEAKEEVTTEPNEAPVVQGSNE